MGAVIPTVVTPNGVALDRMEPTPTDASYGSGDEVAKATQAFGGQVTQLAGEATNAINGTLALDATNKLEQYANQLRYGQPTDASDPTTGGYEGVTGGAAIGADGKPAILDTYRQRLQQHIDSLGAGLSGSAAVQFQQAAQATNTRFQAGLLAHTMQQSEVAASDARNNAYNNALTNVAVDPNGASTIQAGLGTLAMIHGDLTNRMGSVAADTGTAPLYSRYYRTIIASRLQNGDLQNAQAFFDLNKGNMQAEDVAAVGAQLKAQTTRQIGIGAATNATAPLRSQWAPTQLQTIQQVVQSLESGQQGDTKADGSPVVGEPTAGGQQAKYAMQVLPSTAKDANYLGALGVQPAQSDTPAEYDRVGSQMLDALVKKYGGDNQQVLAAYHAGYVAVDAAVAKDGANWLRDMGPKTQAYVAKGMQKLQTGPSGPARLSLNQYTDAAIAALPPGSTPEAREAAISEATRRYNGDLQQYTTNRDNALTAAQQALVQSGGDTNSVPLNVQQALMQYAPDKVDDIKTFARAVNPLTNPTTDAPTFARAVVDPKWLGTLSTPDYEQLKMTMVAPADRPALDGMRNAATGQAPGQLDTSAITTALVPRLKAMGLADPTKTGAAKAAQVQMNGRITSNFTRYIQSMQQSLGRKMSTPEIQTTADQFLATQTPVPIQHWWGGTDTVAQPVAGLTASQFPADRVTAARKALAGMGYTNPRDDQITTVLQQAALKGQNK